MGRWKHCFAGLAVAVTLVVVLSATENVACGQEATGEPTADEASEPDGPDRLSRIEAQLRKLEARNDRMQKRYDDLSRQYQSLRRQASDPVFGSRARNSDGKGIPGGLEFPSSFVVQKSESKGGEQKGEGEAGQHAGGSSQPEESTDEENEDSVVPTIPRTRVRRQSGVSGAGVTITGSPRQSMEEYYNQIGIYKPDMRPPEVPTLVSFREGLEIRSQDNFITLEFHNLTQMDYRDFSNTGDALHNNFVIPRQRWYFQGQLTPYAYYYTAINRGYSTIDLLDSWVDFNFWGRHKEQLQFRVGRMKTPYTYEYIKMSESDLIAPERSIFLGNFSGNRQIGIMAHGQLFEHVMEYYVGVFNGPQRSFEGYNNSKSVYTFLNFKPFLHSGFDWLEQLNLSASYNAGVDLNPLQPAFLTTANDQSDAPQVENVSPTFLVFNNNVFQNGLREQWGGDATYYYKSFTFSSGYQGAFEQYSIEKNVSPSNSIFYQGTTAFVGYGSSQRVTVPMIGWNVAATYFITGEEITRRAYLVQPKRPFGYYNGHLNPGAIELYSRFSDLQLGSQIFTGGLANAKYWSNTASAVDTGVNWYLNNYVRIYLDWQHAMFGSPVYLNSQKSTKEENIYWFRTQLFF